MYIGINKFIVPTSVPICFIMYVHYYLLILLFIIVNIFLQLQIYVIHNNI